MRDEPHCEHCGVGVLDDELLTPTRTARRYLWVCDACHDDMCEEC